MTIRRIDVGPRMSQIVIHNDTVYLAGQVGEPGESVASQTKSVLAQIDELRLPVKELARFPRAQG